MRGLIKLLFPPKCMLCRRPMAQPDSICSACREKVLQNTAPPRIEHGAFFDKAVSGLWYEGDVRHALHRLKYAEKQNYARPLARVMLYAWQHKVGEEADLIAWVPTNPSTLRERGYDQARLLAEALSPLMGVPCVHCLKKSRDTGPMHGLKPDARRANVLGAYTLCCPPQRVEGMRVILVDDIYTTGSTLSECARTLRSAGADRVWGLCAAATPKYSENLQKQKEK